MEMNFNDLKSRAQAAINGFEMVTDVKLLMFPAYTMVDKSITLASAFRARVSNRDGSDAHTVVLTHHVTDGVESFSIVCGDSMSDGTVAEGEARRRCAVAVSGDEDAVAPKVLKGPMALMFQNVYKQYEGSAPCNFWSLAKKKELCSHTQSFLFHLNNHLPDFIKQMRDMSVAGLEGPVASLSKGPIWSLEELAFRSPVLLEGDRGSGKTVEARQFARSRGLQYVECPGHEGIEAPDLLGFLVPYGPGEMVWKDGPLAEAFRKAQYGQVVLVLDELLRIPQRELSILLTTFSPDDGVYRLRTGRMVSVEDGVGTEEVLECAISNLCVIATTNVGAEYAVDEIDPALADRFVLIRKDTTRAKLEHILGMLASKNGLSSSLVKQALGFYDAMLALQKSGMMRNVPTTRTMARAFELALEDEDVQRGLLSQYLLWVARTSDGKAVPEQVKLVESSLKKVFT